LNGTKKSKRRNRNIILSILLVLTLAVTGVLAYVTAGSKEDNVFTIGNVDVNLSEPLWDAQNTSGVLENIIPRQEIDKDPTLTNSGNNDAYVYMMVEIPKTYEIEIANDDGSYETKTHYPLFSIMNSEGEINEVNENWTLIDSKVGTETDAYDYYLYGYNTAIKPEESVKLFDKVKFCNPSSKEAFVDVLTGKSIEDLEVKVTGYAIQNEYHNGEANSVESAWKLFTNQNGWSWPANRYSNVKTIDFVRENGQILHSIHFEDSAKLTLYDNSALDKEGYTRKWVNKATGENAIAGTTITEDTIYVLEYTKMKSLVFEDAEGNVLKTEYFTDSKKISLFYDNSFNRDDHFYYWVYKDTEEKVVDGTNVTENTVIKIQYEKLKVLQFIDDSENPVSVYKFEKEFTLNETHLSTSSFKKEGFTVKWVNKDTGEEAVVGATITEDTTFILKYTPMNYIKFEDENGNLLHTEYFINSITVSLYSDSNLNKVGYTLSWTNKATGETVSNGAKITENTILIATYTAMNYVRYEDEQGNILHTEYFVDSITIKKLLVDESLAKKGHIFAWANKETGEVVENNSTFTQNTILIPQYTEMNYVKYENADGEVIYAEYFDKSTYMYPFFDESLTKDGYAFEWVNKETNKTITLNEEITEKTTYIPVYTETGHGTKPSDYFIFDIYSSSNIEPKKLCAGVADLDVNHPNYPTEPTTVIIPSKISFTVPNDFNTKPTSEQIITADYGSVKVDINTAKILEPGQKYEVYVTDDYIYDWSAHTSIVETLIFADSIVCYQINPMSNSSILKEVVFPYRTDAFWNGSEFENCVALERVHISSCCQFIGVNSFANCTKLKTINITNSIWGIDSNAFLNCTSLTSIRVPYNLFWVEIYPCAFEGCTNLTDVYFAGTEEEWNIPEILTIYEGNEPLLNATIHYNS